MAEAKLLDIFGNGPYWSLTPHEIENQFDAPRAQFVAQPREFCFVDFMDHSKKMADGNF